MSRNLTITTYWTASDGGTDADMCNGRLTCPGVHAIADRPELVYVICASELRDLGDGRVIGAVPAAIHRSGRITGTRVTNPAELLAFADRMAPGEILSTVAVAEWDGAIPVGVA